MEEGGDGEGEETTEDGRDVGGVDIFPKLRTQFTEFSLVRFVRNGF